MRRLLDHLAFKVCEALTPAATRHMCSQGFHDEYLVGTAAYGRYGIEMVACRRTACTHVTQHVVRLSRG